MKGAKAQRKEGKQKVNLIIIREEEKEDEKRRSREEWKEMETIKGATKGINRKQKK